MVPSMAGFTQRQQIPRSVATRLTTFQMMHFQHSVLRLTLAVLADVIVAPQHILPDIPETSLISLLILLASYIWILQLL